MIIYATFVLHKPATEENFELVHAWDEYTIESNPEGYEETLNRELGVYGDDIVSRATVKIHVPHDAVMDALRPQEPTIKGMIV